MVDHTLERIVQVPEAQEKLQNATSTDDNSTGTLHCKIGFDGASSQSVYKQKYEETELTDAKKNEESLFQTAFVPLKLTIKDKNIQLSEKPSSTHYCRPVNLQYKKETPEVSQGEAKRLEEEIEALNHHVLELEDENGRKTNHIINFKVDMTMFDGKVVNALTDTKSTQSCNVCDAKPSEMNNVKIIRKKK